MRFTTILFRNARRPQNEQAVPIKPKMPLILKNRVAPTSQRGIENGCLHEMSLLLNCLQENAFEDKKCIPQLSGLEKCYATYTKNMERLHGQYEEVKPVPNSKNCTHKQITYLLRQYPTV
ncbi:hypothetical protein DMN91_004278 [Ooceraea biroi]|uniref:Coiled-coil-helix-coiled-coil-helix domain-containing protein n=1 Tax=Ooceraea biroi TaxID=2015173 RepID=A0A026VWX7_OOCBI|nr:coiled-coil-helix-coiled-coil-helix domain-containing protein 1 [Ooceraea biroi]EZA48125.1 Coiled-coil-helix-coiled-coil-helix domain-containing protein [Ooceraea biroi]RLU24069.1 hypothetical protein DMN91_004278 [Ooceraea biroi]